MSSRGRRAWAQHVGRTKKPWNYSHYTAPGTVQRRHRRALGVPLALALALLLMPTLADAAGYYLPGRGVRPMGRAGTFVASGAGDLNSLWYNPANLVFDRGLQLTIDSAFLDLDFRFARAPRTDEYGATTEYAPVSNEAPLQPSPQILIGGPTPLDGLSWAAGFYAPYTAAMTFPATGAQRYTLLTNSGSFLGFVHAALGYQIGDAIRVGAGFQNVIASSRMVSITSGYTGLHGRPEDPNLDILSEVRINDYFIPTGNAGIWLKLGPHIEAALAFQGPVYVQDDNATLKIRMPDSPEFDHATMSNDKISAAIQMPAVVRAGLRFVSESVDVELSADWQGWSIFDEVRATPKDIRVENAPGLSAIPIGPLSIPMHFQDTYSLRLGGDWRARHNLSVRAGLGFETTATPDEYYSVLMPESQKYFFSTGLSWDIDAWSFDLAAAYYHFADRTITNSQVHQLNPTDTANQLTSIVANGDYTARYIAFGLGITYAFGHDDPPAPGDEPAL